MNLIVKYRIYFLTFIFTVAVVTFLYITFRSKTLDTAETNQNSEEWTEINEYISYFKLDYDIDRQKGDIVIYRLNGRKYKPELLYSQEAKSIQDWKSESDELIINGCFFEENYSPSGYLQINSNIIGSNIFDQNHSGIIAFTGNDISIRNLRYNKLHSSEFENILQSFPMLIDNNNIEEVNISENKARRTAIGLEGETVYLIISDEGNLTLSDFAKILADFEVDFDNVLNLDGGPSTGIYVNVDGYENLIDSKWKVPNVIRFTRV